MRGAGWSMSIERGSSVSTSTGLWGRSGVSAPICGVWLCHVRDHRQHLIRDVDVRGTGNFIPGLASGFHAGLLDPSVQ